MQRCDLWLARAAAMVLVFLICGSHPTVFAQTPSPIAADPPGAPIRLRQTPQALPPKEASLPAERNVNAREARTDTESRNRLGEFESYIQLLSDDRTLRRFGSDLIIDAAVSGSEVPDANPQVPPDYRVAAGDELLVSIWGSVDADLRLAVDRSGRISIPRIGSFSVSGLTVPEVAVAIDRQARKIFKNFELTVTLGQLRNIRVFVTGFAVRPGAYTVNSLSTLSALIFGRSGGPSASGSFRDIELRRAGRTLAKLDLYDLMLFGRRDADQQLQADDVIHIGPVDRQVALIGSVNKPAIFDLKQAETVGDLLRMGGGFNSVADRSRVAVEQLSERNNRRVRQLALPADAGLPLEAGDLVRVFSAIDAVLPLERQNKRVRVEGEVTRPGTYILPPESTIADALQIAGNLTPAAYLFGTEFSRESVRKDQQANYERALRDIELEFTRRASAAPTRDAEGAASQVQQQVASDRLLARLRDARPTGRVVLQLTADTRQLPNLALEDGDRLFVPPVPSTVGVFGSVFNAGSYLYSDQRNLGDYLRLAGSPTRGADRESIFVVRANGTVLSAQQDKGSWFGINSNSITEITSLPGDTIFVPEEINKTTFLQSAKDWSQVLYQLGLGVASIKLILP